ncbi:MAG: hypothetical protein P8Q42_01115 [Flavobacteriales bacterium]|nr:hypothetical protein [Flavobacteriales bacterium]
MGKHTKFSKESKLKAVHLSEKSDNIKNLAISLGIDGAITLRMEEKIL